MHALSGRDDIQAPIPETRCLYIEMVLQVMTSKYFQSELILSPQALRSTEMFAI